MRWNALAVVDVLLRSFRIMYNSNPSLSIDLDPYFTVLVRPRITYSQCKCFSIEYGKESDLLTLSTPSIRFFIYRVR